MQVSRSILISKIKKCFPFNRLEDLTIARLIDQSEVLFFEKDQLIFREGTSAGHLYLVLEGQVSLLKEKNGTLLEINRKTEGGVFGEDSLLEKKKRLATIRADKNMMVLKVPVNDLADSFGGDPGIKESLDILKNSYQCLVSGKSRVLPDESIFYLGRPHPFLFFSHLWLPLILVGVIISVYLLVDGSIPQSALSIAMLAGGSFLLFCSILLWQYMEWRENTLLVSNKRVVSREIRLFRSEAVMDTPLNTVMNIRLTKPLAGRIFRFGDLSIDTFTGENRVRAVPLADQVQALIEFLLQSTRVENQLKEQEAFKEILTAREIPVNHDGSGSQSMPSKDLELTDDGKGSRPALIYRTHWAILLKKVLLPTLVFAMFILGSAFLYLNGLISLGNLPYFFLILVGLSGSIVWWLYQYFDWYFDRYQIVNDQIVDINQKPFGREERRTASIFNIQSIRFERKGLMGILLNYGTVFIRIGDEEFTFDKVPNPAGVQSSIFRALESSISGKQARELTDQQVRLANWLEAYRQMDKDREDQPE